MKKTILFLVAALMLNSSITACTTCGCRKGAKTESTSKETKKGKKSKQTKRMRKKSNSEQGNA